MKENLFKVVKSEFIDNKIKIETRLYQSFNNIIKSTLFKYPLQYYIIEVNQTPIDIEYNGKNLKIKFLKTV